MLYLFKTTRYLRAKPNLTHSRSITMAEGTTTSTATSDHTITCEDVIHQYTAVNSRDSAQGGSWLGWLPSWKPTSNDLLIQSESELLNKLTSPYVDLFVPIDDGTSIIRTITIPPDQPTSLSPLVMVHGFGCGLAAFYKNFDSLHSTRRLFAFDVLGFGRSSRAKFGSTPESVEEEFVSSFEKWREALGIEKMILLGHSLGAFMSCAYSMRYPERIQHLILVEPWGFIRKPEVVDSRFMNSRMFKIAKSFTSQFNMFAPIRVAGPLGPSLVSRFRPDLEAKFGDTFMKYVYHCNAQEPSGESAFFYLQIPIAWARRPMMERLDDLHPGLPVSLMYGTRSWFDNDTGKVFYSMRPGSYVDVHFVKGAGHHIHADAPVIFNEIVNSICRLSDEHKDVLMHDTIRTEEEAFITH